MSMPGPGREGVATRPSAAAVAVEAIEAIGASDHAIPRNLRITQAYHELSTAAAAVLGPGANWCTFATWASKQAGQTIRGDDLGRKLEDAFVQSAAVQLAVARIRDLRRAVGRAVDANEVLGALRKACAPLLAVTRVADAVARGNKKVFDEIGVEFARFVTVLGAPDDDTAAEKFFGRFRPGAPPDGQDLLAAAFRDYDRVRRITDPKLRAERLFLANVRIGMHEQTRLQPDIADALDAPIPDPVAISRELLATLFSGRLGRLPGPRPALVDVTRRLLEPLRAVVRRVVTEELMTLTLHERCLRLGTDCAGSYPAHLLKLEDPDVIAFVRVVDPKADSLAGSGADDWANLAERMHMIVELFRLEHQNADLFQPPFTAEQLRMMAAGRVPDGRL